MSCAFGTAGGGGCSRRSEGGRGEARGPAARQGPDILDGLLVPCVCSRRRNHSRMLSCPGGRLCLRIRGHPRARGRLQRPCGTRLGRRVPPAADCAAQPLCPLAVPGPVLSRTGAALMCPGRGSSGCRSLLKKHLGGGRQGTCRASGGVSRLPSGLRPTSDAVAVPQVLGSRCSPVGSLRAPGLGVPAHTEMCRDVLPEGP